MGRAVKICVALAFLAGQRGVAHHPAPAQEASPPEDVVVTARPGAPPPRLDAIGYYRRYCFDANRLTGRSAPPVDDADWEPLDDDLRAKFGLFDSQAPAFSLVDRERGYTLVIKFETFARPGALVENRCTLIVRGGGEHGKLGAAMNALFRGPGTERHVGQRAGTPKLPGWRQWLWTAIPDRGSTNWRVVEAPGAARAAGTYVIVADEHLFYNQADYVFGDLKIREHGIPLSMISFSFTHRKDR